MIIYIYIQVNTKKSSLILGKYSKLAPRYFNPFEILAKVGLVAYQLSLPPNIKVHHVFHVYILKRYVHHASQVIDWNVIQVEPKGEFQVGLERILDRRELLLRNRTIGQVKVQWKHLSPEESTWKLEAYPILFQNEEMEA